MKRIPILVATFSLCISLPLIADEQDPDAKRGPDIDRPSERILLDACGYLRSADRYSVKTAVSYEDILTDGTRVEYHRESSVVLERPDHLRIDSESDKGRRSFFYDGKTLTVYRPDEGIYAVVPAPDTIDSLVDAVEARGIAMPASDLLLNQPCQALADHLETGTFAGRHYLDGDWYNHLLLSTDAVDVQLWVGQGDDPEIHRLVLTYSKQPGEPQYRVFFRDWNFSPLIDGSTFTFVPPAGARKVALRNPGSNEGGGE